MMNPVKCLVRSILLASLLCHVARAQQLILHYDFEGDSFLSIQDKSGFGEPANGILVGVTSSIVSDPERGDVLYTGSGGFGATIPHSRKMDFRNSFTLQAWIKTANSVEAWQQIAGIGGEGPRIFNHWGLGSLGTAQLWNTEFSIFDGFTPVDIVSPTGFVDGSSWHHVLVTWNSVEQKLYGYYDGFDGGDPDDTALTPVDTLGDLLLTKPDLSFDIGGTTGSAGSAIPNTYIDDVAFWQGYAPPDLVAGLFEGTISIAEAASLMTLPGATADFNGDGYVDGNDLLAWQRGFGLDDVATQAVRLADGDANGDLIVDGLDRVNWESEFGTVPQIISAAVVPETNSAVMLCSAFMLICANLSHLRFRLKT
jgi:hypothetical protein